MSCNCTRKIGSFYENLACKYLLDNQLIFVAKNYYSRYGEIDLIMTEGDTIVFIEVRYRKNYNYGHPLETINSKKQQKLILTAYDFLENHVQFNELYMRFDAISISDSKSDTSQKKYARINSKYNESSSYLTWYKNIISKD